MGLRKFGEQPPTTEERGEYYDLRRKVTMCSKLQSTSMATEWDGRFDLAADRR